MTNKNSKKTDIENTFSSNTEYLNTFFQIFDEYKTKAEKLRIEKLNIPKPELTSKISIITEGILEKFKLLFKKGQKSLKNGIPIYLEKLSNTKNLSEIEKIIIIYYLNNELNGRIKYYNDPFEWENILVFLSSIYKKDKINFVPYFLPSSPLFKKDIFNIENHYRESGLRFDLKFKTEILEYLLTGIDPLKNKRKSNPIVINSPMDIFQRLDAKIVSQEKAKKLVSVIAYQHLNRPLAHSKIQTIPHLNILLIGPTGCGKTYIAKTLSEILNVPIAFCDATQYTETGYVGANVEDMLVSLYNAAGKDYEKMSKGIIFIDEIDKISGQPVGAHNSNRDVSGLSVQQELLKMLDGEIVNYDERIHWGYQNHSFDTRNILFILAGAFDGIEDIIRKRLKTSRKIGFIESHDNLKFSEPHNNSILSHIIPQDIIDYGMMPELIGRIPNIITIDNLTKEDFIKILNNHQTSLIDYYRSFFRERNIQIKIPQEIIEKMAQEAVKQNLGARGLNALVEKYFSDLLFENMKNQKKFSSRFKEETDSEDLFKKVTFES
jgi:ATP-dependent Clp protease ATP-binding subunit ClpX